MHVTNVSSVVNHTSLINGIMIVSLYYSFPRKHLSCSGIMADD